MILATFEFDGSVRLGLVLPQENAVVDIPAVERMLGLSSSGPPPRFGAMRDAILAEEHIIRLAHDLPRPSLEKSNASAIPLDKVRLKPPLLPSRNIFCVGLNYIDHIKEGDQAQQTKRDIPGVPHFFTKPYTSIIGDGDAIPSHLELTQKLDYEGELAVVIGKPGRDIPRDKAHEHIFGFSIINDISARDLQRYHGQWFKGKALDGTCPFGPWIVHRTALPQFGDIAVRTLVNGEVRQDSRTSSMIFDVPRIIEELSRGMALEPGDVIATGTPSGVGYAMSPPSFLKVGDVVEVEIEGIGTLRNHISSS